MSNKIGVIHITVCIKLDQPVTPEVAREFVQELDYNIKDTTGKVTIQDTEIIEDNIEEDEDVPEFDGYVSLDECIESGEHLKNCDEDGYCNNCGCQDHSEDLE